MCVFLKTDISCENHKIIIEVWGRTKIKKSSLNVHVQNVWYVELCHFQTRSADTNSNKHPANKSTKLIQWIYKRWESATCYHQSHVFIIKIDEFLKNYTRARFRIFFYCLYKNSIRKQVFFRVQCSQMAQSKTIFLVFSKFFIQYARIIYFSVFFVT